MGQLDDLNCGNCGALIVDHDMMALKICLHRLGTEKRDLAEKVLSFLKENHAVWIALGTHSPRAAAGTITEALQRIFVAGG